IDSLVDQNGVTEVRLKNAADFPMPVDVLATYSDGSKEFFYIPMNELMGIKPVEDKTIKRTDLPVWAWVSPTYAFKITRPKSQIVKLEIDPSQRMADINPKNNVWSASEKK
ncbi:MAG TPA: M1 family peptidase, partial [Cyclobacteriaceae bacterium]|nr:M1 family peptidase [Cyclobacteriaceae bacterium]